MYALFESAAYMPHGYCLFWQPWLVALFAGSDLLIFLSYSAIPLALLIFLRRRPDIRYRFLVALFASFIMLCGLTHLVSITTLWVPVYPLHGLVKLVTGLVSMTTAVVLFLLIPALVKIPSPRQLEEAHDELRTEIAAHEQTLARLRETQREIEEEIARRTAELTAANERLTVISRETVHRKANMMAVISSLARETARRARDLEEFVERFLGRLQALAGATAALTAGPSGPRTLLGDVVRRQLEPMMETFGNRIVVHGPEVEVGSIAAQQLSLAVYELATNAVKYGALATPDGRVTLSWSVADGGLTLQWDEDSCPKAPCSGPPNRSGGFGTVLVTRAIPSTLGGTAERDVRPEGLSYALTVPLSRVEPDPYDRDGGYPDMAPMPA
jgi:two-component sensor histidine kinase